MARIRSIKPEFWTSEQVMECSLNARLLFIGMWNFADDLGRLPMSLKTIKASVFPGDDISLDVVRGMIDELSKNGLVLTYVIEDREYLQITGWQHQRIDKPQAGKCPAPVNGYSKVIPRTLPPDRKGEDRDGKDTLPSVAIRASERKAPAKSKKHPVPLSASWIPSSKSYEIAEQFGQNVQIIEGIFRDYLASSGKLYADYDAAFHNFIRNQNSFNRGGANGVRQPENRGSIVNAADRAIAKLEREIAADHQICADAVLSLSQE